MISKRGAMKNHVSWRNNNACYTCSYVGSIDVTDRTRASLDSTRHLSLSPKATSPEPQPATATIYLFRLLLQKELVRGHAFSSG